MNPTDSHRSPTFLRPRGTLLVVGLLLMATALYVAGCNQQRGPVRKTGGAGRDRSGELLEVVASQLAGLPELGVVELEPEVPILDAKTSSDGQDVLARVVINPDQPLLNRLVVPAGNARFRSLGVQPGDIVRYYVRVASELEDEYRTRRGRLTAAELEALYQEREAQRDILLDSADPTDIRIRIAQVIDENTLLLEEPLNTMLQEGTLAPAAFGDGARLEVWRVSNQRMGDLVVALHRYAISGVPRLGWEPSPDKGGVEKIVEHLNQWLRQSKLESEWKMSDMLATLPEDLRDNPVLAPFISRDALERMSFSMPTEELRAVQGTAYEGRLLQEATFARDVSTWATEGTPQAQDKVALLFDWTVRNVQLYDDTEGATDERPAYRPWQSMIYARGEVESRIWVFAQLCRQLGVPVVVFEITPPATEGDDDNSTNSYLVCGALVREHVYLFDPYLGLALPAEGLRPATLAQVREKPDLLRTLDLEGEAYPVTAETLEAAKVMIVAEPFTLTHRAALLESRLTGDDSLVLAESPERVAELLKSAGVATEPVLWPHPFEVLLAQLEQPPPKRRVAALEFEPFCYRPYLWQARVLHFRGRQPTGEGVLSKYSTSSDDHRDAGRDYTRSSVMATYKEIGEQEAPEVKRTWLAARVNATYWVGLLKYDQGEPRVALDWFRRAESTEQLPMKWDAAARYNEARALEALGQTDEAIALLEDDKSPIATGSRHRAQLLRQLNMAEQSE